MESRSDFSSGILVGLGIGLLLGIGVMLVLAPTPKLEPVDEKPRVGENRVDERRERDGDGETGTRSDRGTLPVRVDDAGTSEGPPAVDDDRSGSAASTDVDENETEDVDLAARIKRLEWELKGKADDPRLIREYIEAMTEAGTPALAVEFFEKVLAEDPDNVEAMVGLGIAATRESGRLSGQGAAGMMAAGKFAFRAHEIFGAAIDKNEGEHETARFHRALLGVYAPKFLKWDGQAEKDLKKLIENQGGRSTETGAEPYYHLGELYRRANRTEEARKILEEGAARYPTSEEIRAKLEAIKD